ncbi:TPA: DUF1653 domain-containing protein [Candidatus Bathyarchaeota archaeon]|nr:DUF1653 domain-containing protein [Candidatus Bathyarchaeota archaeon]
MSKIKVGEIFKHFKGGQYKIVAVAKDCDSPEKELVVYEQLYDSDGFSKGTIWIRALEDFDGEKVLEDGTKVKRFVGWMMSKQNNWLCLKEGDIIEVLGERFEVVKIRYEAEPAPKRGKLIRRYTCFELYRKGQKSFFPSCFLKFYEGGEIRFINSKIILERDIKKIK